MAVASIEELKKNKEDLRSAIKSIKTWNIDTEIFGSEKEYNGKALKGGLDAILTDLTAITKAEKQLLKTTNKTERATISSHIKNLILATESKDGESIAIYIDNIKPIFRQLNIRNSSERLTAFTEACDQLQITATQLSIILEKNKERLAELDEKIESQENKSSELLVLSENLESCINETKSKISELIDIEQEAQSTYSSILDAEEKITSTHSSINEKSALIENFSKKIALRESQLEEQQQKTKDYLQKIADFENGYSEILAKGKSLIDQSREALGYTTAQGLSAAFHEQHIQAKSDKAINGWIASGGIFMTAAIAIGLWVAVASHSSSIELIIARLSLIPLCVAGAWFSASQYVKLKNLAEDYAYKTVLAKSLIGFSEQIRQSDNHTTSHSTYLEKVLTEIHKDPLRARSKDQKHPDTSPSPSDLKLVLDDIRSALEKLSK